VPFEFLQRNSRWPVGSARLRLAGFGSIVTPRDPPRVVTKGARCLGWLLCAAPLPGSVEETDDGFKITNCPVKSVKASQSVGAA
jgi:hypothetical protein